MKILKTDSIYLSLHQVNVERRLFIFRFGDPQARMNWVHVDNLVMAHTLAAEALTPQRSHVSVSHRSMWLHPQIIIILLFGFNIY